MYLIDTLRQTLIYDVLSENRQQQEQIRFERMREKNRFTKHMGNRYFLSGFVSAAILSVAIFFVVKLL